MSSISPPARVRPLITNAHAVINELGEIYLPSLIQLADRDSLEERGAHTYNFMKLSYFSGVELLSTK